jgi:hypothetical protein
MMQDRSLTAHAYNRATADAIASQIVDVYLPCYHALRIRLQQRLLPPLPAKLTPLHFDHQGGLMEQSYASLQRSRQG